MPELAEIFRRYAPAYLASAPQPLLPAQLRAIRDISACRTPARGGSLYACPQCHDSFRYSYHSCGNRACPKCGNDHTSQWLHQQRQLLLPTDYFLITFTLPNECRPVARSHQKSVYSAFFRAASHALLSLARDPKYLGGTPGIIGILQTWRSDLGYHVHIHFIVTAGALSPRHDRWIPHRYRDWLLPHKALAALVKLRFEAELSALRLLHLVHHRVWSRRFKWVVDCRHAGSGLEVLNYLAPYVFRIALANNRITSLRDDLVTFRVKDRPSASWTSLSLSASDFIHRFLLHVLPKGFVKVRYYGLFAPKLRASLIPLARALLPRASTGSHVSSPPPPPRPLRCPSCGALMIFSMRLLPDHSPRAPP